MRYLSHLSHIPSVATRAVQSCAYGAVNIAYSPDGETVSLSSTPSHVVFAELNEHAVLKSLGLHQSSGHKIKIAHVASCGLPFLYLRVDDDATVTAARSSTEGVHDILLALDSRYQKHDLKGIFKAQGVVMYWVDPEASHQDGVIVHQRVFTTDIAEDPATGSASIACVLQLFLFYLRRSLGFVYHLQIADSPSSQTITGAAHARSTHSSKLRAHSSDHGAERRADHRGTLHDIARRGNGSAICTERSCDSRKRR